MLTKLDMAALRQGNDITVHLSKLSQDGLVRVIKRKPMFGNDPFAVDREHILTAKAKLHGARGQEEIKCGIAKCFEMMSIYHDQHGHLASVLKTLRLGDELTFVFWPDAHTNGYVAMAGLHADAIYLEVRRDGRMIAQWELHTSVCPPNTARMCYGVPNSATYDKDAAEARKVA